MNVLVVIPSFRPPESLPKLCADLRDLGLRDILVVNDGSPSAYDKVFNELSSDGVTVFGLPTNQGKGGALRAGLQHALDARTDWDHIVFCDDDGQHAPQDVLKVAQAAHSQRRPFVMGMRTVGDAMPWKSWLGNAFMSWLVRTKHGLDCPDTQSGLRCFSRQTSTLLLEVEAKRFGFEIVTLLRLHYEGVDPHTVPIQTIYYLRNERTRFRFIRDSAQVMALAFNFPVPRRND